MSRLDRSFFARDSSRVARELLGAVLVRARERETLKGRIVETEAYYGEADPPSHAFSGKTGRSEIMWKKPGLAYVYLVYGVHLMLNVVTEPSGTPGAVLIRAVEPLEGLETMKTNRGRSDVESLTDGPGKLTEAFAVGKGKNGDDLISSGELWLSEGERRTEEKVASSGRIGVTRGEEEQLRFFLPGNEFVSE
ncbi:MAG: DNA-3-methyladenine glycosylase [Candidatus Bipolaricaulia bacterium]